MRTNTTWKYASLGILLSATPAIALAEWEATLGYYDFNNIPFFDNLGAAVFGIGYRISFNESLSITPGVRIGDGIRNGEIPIRRGTDQNGELVVVTSYLETSIDHFYSLQYRTEWSFANGFYTYLNPSLSEIKIESADPTRNIRLTFSDSNSGFGMGLGIGYQFSKSLSIEAAAENIDLFIGDKPQFLNLQARYLF